MKTLWIILAGVGGACAVVFVFRGDYEKAFVAAAISIPIFSLAGIVAEAICSLIGVAVAEIVRANF